MDQERWNGNSDKMPKAYWTKEVAETLGISDSYLRKWCLELEKNGYPFLKVKDGKNRDNRAFTEHDVIALRKFQSLLSQPNITRAQAAEIVASEYAPLDRNSQELSTFLRDNDRDKAQQEIHTIILKNVIEELQKEFNDMEERIVDRVGERLEKRIEEQIEHHLDAMVTKLLEQREKQITSHMSQRLEHHEKQVMDAVNEIKASHLESATGKEESKKGFLSRLFRRK
jgi:transposase